MDTSIKTNLTSTLLKPAPAALESIPQGRSTRFSQVLSDVQNKTAENTGKPAVNRIWDLSVPGHPRRMLEGSATNAEVRESILEYARENPANAIAMANSYAYNSLSQELLDVTDRENTRYSSSGELVTPQSEAYFGKVRQAMQQQRTGLYEAELAKGTPMVDIIDKIFDFNNSLPTRFLEMAGW